MHSGICQNGLQYEWIDCYFHEIYDLLIFYCDRINGGIIRFDHKRDPNFTHVQEKGLQQLSELVELNKVGNFLVDVSFKNPKFQTRTLP